MDKNNNIFQKIQQLDRRYIYIILAVAIILPLIFPYNSKTYTTKPAENIYRMIDSFAPVFPEGATEEEKDAIAMAHDKAVMLAFWHDASTMSELFPMELSIIRHCFERRIKFFTFTIFATSAPIIDMAINEVKKSDPEKYGNKKSGEDYVNFGYKVSSLLLPIIFGMGEDISDAMDIDAEGRKVSSLPIMTNIKNYNDMNLVIDFSASSAGTYWIYYARPRFGVNVAVGVTAVMAADTYPQLQTGQFIGMLAGMKGAAEYEKLVDVFASTQREFSSEILRNEAEPIISGDTNLPYPFRQARIGMNAQSIAHILIIVFILIGNVGFFVQKHLQKNDN
ncbi:MAG: hypothetical protein FWG20_02790 [Candidatus Cloacimonetes bacterium]|nr:hypothetical protein [Candidatus Cloacimonadota bacterium]